MRTILKNGILAVQITRELFNEAVASGEMVRVNAALAIRSKEGRIKIRFEFI
jgi:hypothetical protein